MSGWARHITSATPSCPHFTTSRPSASIRWPIRPSVWRSPWCWSSARGSFSPNGRAWGCSLTRTLVGWVFLTGAAGLIYRSIYPRCHHQMDVQRTTTTIHDHHTPLGDSPPPVPQPVNNNETQVPTTHGDKARRAPTITTTTRMTIITTCE